MVKLTGIPRNKLTTGVLWGVGIGIIFIVINRLTQSIFSLGLPTLPQQVIGGVMVGIIVAPILEEIFFRGLIYSVLKEATRSKWTAIIGQAVAFSMFHFLAWTGGFYAGLGTMSGAFISAGIFGIIAQIIVNKTDSLVGSIIAHMIFNTFLLAGTFLVIAV